MKNSKSTVAALAAAVLTMIPSCKDNYIPENLETTEPEKIQLSLNVKPATLSTKVTENWSENEVQSLQIFVFNSDGSLDISGKSTTSSIQLNVVPANGKKIYAIVNDSYDGNVAKESDLAAYSSKLTVNSSENMVMTGSKSSVDLQSASTVIVPVSRNAAKITIGKITNKFSDPTLQAKTFKVTSIYVINSSTSSLPWESGTYEVTDWANMMAHKDSAYDGYLYDNVGSSIAYGRSYTTEHHFYTYPNNTSTDANDGTWSPRKTRLVVEATIGGTTCYYPITFDSIAENTHYSISELIVTRIGSDSPDKPVTTSSVSFTIDIVDWNNSSIGDVTI